MGSKISAALGACILAFGVGLTGCGSKSETAKKLEYAQNLEQSVEQFEQTRAETAKELSEKTEAVAKQLAEPGGGGELKDAAEAWEGAWDDVDKRMTALEANFREVNKSSEQYFAKLDELAEGISNPVLKASEKEKNRRVRARWIVTYNEAAEGIGRMRNLKAEAGDFEKVMQGAAMRDRIEKNVADLRDISSRAEVLLADLGRLTAEGKRLIHA